MRVAVQCPDDHPVSPGAVFAYRLGRIQDGVHNVLAHMDSPIPIEEFVQSLVAKAKADFPNHEVRLEKLVDNGDGTAQWIPADEETDAPAAPEGENHAATIGVVADAGAAA